MRGARTLLAGFDLYLAGSALLLAVFGLVTMYTYQGDNFFFHRQLVWIGVAMIGMVIALIPDYRILRLGNAGFYLYIASLISLLLLFFFGDITLGAQRRFDLGFFAFQPSDPAKLIIIILLAKYFSKRHTVIGDFRHILISGLYVFIPFALIFLQPDFGTAVILLFLWFGIVLVSGIKLRHIVTVFLVALGSFALLWQLAFADYQKQRIVTFLNPVEDIQGAGWNAYQSQVAVGSGQLFGKGIGYGTQSKLLFLPEYQTDFIFAAFAEEWGFSGVILLFTVFGVLIWRLLYLATKVQTNFESLFIVGVAVLFISHFFVHIGMNIGVLPVTGLTMPFMSYGGSHLLTSFVALGMVMAMRYTGATKHAIGAGDELVAVPQSTTR